MLAACAARLQDRDDLVWVDLGGGTGVRVFRWALLCVHKGGHLALGVTPPSGRAF
jgi:hypothetical protein